MIERLTEFFKLSEGLKKEPRRGWMKKIGVERPESVADHTCLTIVISMVIGDVKGLDTCRMMRMAAIHDLAEALTGDLTPEERAKKSLTGEEHKAVRRLFSYLPLNLRKEYLKILTELDSRGSKEAKLVLEADKFEMALQALEYHREGYSLEKVKVFIESAEREVSDPLLRGILEGLQSKRRS